MLRKIVGVIIGYAIFVISAVFFFRSAGVDPHADAPIGFQLITGCYGAFFSMLAGYLLQLIAKAGNIKPNYALAFIIAGFAAFSMVKSTGNSWTQLQAIFIFAPASVLGGWIFLKRNSR